MPKWKILVVEDERLTREHICELVESDPELDLVGSCSAVREAIKTISNTKPDLLLLDIQLPDGQSFEILKELTKVPAMIFITAYDRYAIRAFEEQAIDYLLKPFARERFFEAVKRAKTRLSQAQTGLTFDELQILIDRVTVANLPSRSGELINRDKIPIKENGKITLHPIEKITKLVVENEHVLIYFGAVAHKTNESLATLEERLSGKGFVRVHRSTVVNLNAIAEIERWFHGDFILILHDGSRVKLSRRYKSNLEALLGSKI